MVMAEQKNLFPTMRNFSKEGNASTTIAYVDGDDYSCSWTATSEDDFLYCKLTGYAGKTLQLGCTEFNSSDGLAWIYTRAYKEDGTTYTTPLSIENVTGGQKLEMEVPADCTTLRIYFRHAYDSDGIDPAATITLTGAYLYEKKVVESLTTLNFHKVLKENLPKSVTAGTEHVYYTTDGTIVEMYISNKLGGLIPVGGSGGSSAASSEYTNAYTQQWITERRQEIIDLTRAGHCIVFAVATDIHVRIEDGDAGRYNQVRDFVMMSKQLPLDYILCEGDIMSYCQNWDGVFEPRTEKVKNILNQARCPWFAVRGNHDYNDDDYNPDNNPNIVQMTKDNANQLFITNNDWYKTIVANLPTGANYEIVFDEERHQYGYFYVDDYAHKHRMIFLNSEETIETANGTPYITASGQVAATMSGVESKHQVTWLFNRAMDMTGKSDWVVSFHSHTVPYTDSAEDDKSEFHGYGWNNERLRKAVKAFQDGVAYNEPSYSVLNAVTNSWVSIAVNKDFSAQGAIKVIGWFGGHSHDDCYKKVNGLNIDISTCTCGSRRTSWELDATPTKLPPERNSTNYAMSANVFVINLDTRTVKMIKLGSKRDNTVKTSSDLSFTY